MNLWEQFLRLEVFTQYELSLKEQAIILAKFPDEKTVKTNNEVADLATDNNKLPLDPETIRRQMWTIYNERFRPKEGCEGFPSSSLRSGDVKDKAFLEWLNTQYLGWSKKHNNSHFTTLLKTDNPFVPLNGMIEDPRLLFGREREIGSIFEVLKSSSVSLIGEREIGKSSLLAAVFQQAEHRLEPPRKPIYLNLQLICNKDDFWQALCENVGISINKGISLYRELQQHRLLLILDEVEKMTLPEFSELPENLRGLAYSSTSPLRLVVATRTSLSILFPDSQTITSPFYGIFREESIEPWNEATSRAFISDRLAKNSVQFTEKEIIQIVKESGGYPKRLMNCCYDTYANYIKGVK
mgnify:CR=1 FL=1